MKLDTVDEFLGIEDKNEIDLEAGIVSNVNKKKKKKKLPSLRNSLEKAILDKMETR